MIHTLGLLYCSIVWGATFFIVKDALREIDPLAMVAHRFILCALLLLPWIIRKRLLLRSFGPAWRLSVPLCLLYVIQTVGLVHTSASNVGFITGLFVIFVPAFVAWKERRAPIATQWIAPAISVLGLWLLTGEASSINKGDLLAMSSAVFYAAHVVMTDTYVRREEDLLALAFHQCWMTGLASLGLALVLGRSLAIPSAQSAWVIAGLAVVPTLSGFFVQMSAQKHVSPLRVSLAFSLEPVFAAAFSWTLGHEPFRAVHALGGGIIVLAMVTGELANHAAAKRSNATTIAASSE